MLDAVIIGAGPYGLSIGAYFRKRGVHFQIYGRPMDCWLNHMPEGMLLKSDGFASNLYDPGDEFTLGRFCQERGIEYKDMALPVMLETFSAYGLAFRDRMVPELEEKLVTRVERVSGGFVVELETGEILRTARVILAVGITHFSYTPDCLARLPESFRSHSFQHHNLQPFAGRRVLVIGGGASAIDLAGLLIRTGATVQLATRKTVLNFHSRPSGKPRSLYQRLRYPKSGLGPGLRSRFFANAPGAFYHLPESIRVELVRVSLGPSGGWFSKDIVIGKVPLLLGLTLEKALVQGGEVGVVLRGKDGSAREVRVDHVIAATGYRVDLDRLAFLSQEIRTRIRTVQGSPALSKAFESSIPGLYFVGLAAANSFGPVMRFAFGAGYAAKRLTQNLTSAAVKHSVPVPAAIPS
jgi:thioredoxin reductase